MIKFKPSTTNSYINYAGFSKRLLAHNIDLLPLLGFFYLINTFIPYSGNIWEIAIGMGIIYLLYHVVSESYWAGSTIGKKCIKLSVKDLQGEKAKFLNIFVRNIIKFFSFAFLFSGFIMMHFNSKRRGLHDLIAGTIVIVEKE